jgi:hypothetical protein
MCGDARGGDDTGVTARDIPLPVRTDKVQVVSYIDILTGVARAGRKVAVIGGKQGVYNKCVTAKEQLHEWMLLVDE